MNTFSLEQVKEICSLEAEIIRLTNGIKEIIKLSNAGKTLPHVDSHIASFCKKLINTEPPLPNTPVLSAEEAVKKLEWYAWSEWGMIAYKEGVRIEDVFILRQNVLDILGASVQQDSIAGCDAVRSSVGNSLEEAWFWWKETLNYSEAKLIAEKYRVKPPMTDEKVLFMFNSEQSAKASVATESDQGGADGKQNLEALREKFFKECVGDYWTLESGQHKSVDITPHDVFNWFMPYLK